MTRRRQCSFSSSRVDTVITRCTREAVTVSSYELQHAQVGVTPVFPTHCHLGMVCVSQYILAPNNKYHIKGSFSETVSHILGFNVALLYEFLPLYFGGGMGR